MFDSPFYHFWGLFSVRSIENSTWLRPVSPRKGSAAGGGSQVAQGGVGCGKGSDTSLQGSRSLGRKGFSPCLRNTVPCLTWIMLPTSTTACWRRSFWPQFKNGNTKAKRLNDFPRSHCKEIVKLAFYHNTGLNPKLRPPPLPLVSPLYCGI